MMQARRKRLAVTIAGAVSLGSYEGGVLYEILEALRAHNASVTDPNQRIEIDVLTGASAGGMTASILAHRLLFDGASLQGPTDNPLYQAWVEWADIDDLLRERPDRETAAQSILSSACVEDIAERVFLERYRPPLLPGPAPHPALIRQGTLRLGMALANLDGVDHYLKFPGGKVLDFPYTRFQDEFIRDFAVGNPTQPNGNPAPPHDSKAYWSTVADAAVSCGAFPFAFREKKVTRTPKEYESEYSQVYVPPGKTPLPPESRFGYVDGGTFQNEPLGLAKTLVDLNDHHLNQESRFFLYVSPSAKESHASPARPDEILNMLGLGKKLANAVFWQARYQDWVGVESINDQVLRFDKQVAKLEADICAGKVDFNSLIPAAKTLLPSWYGDGLVNIETDRSRLRELYREEWSRLQQAANVGVAGADAWLDAVLVLERVSELRERDVMNLLTITAREDELAGEGLVAFAGFLHQEWREHDYLVGRKKAQEFLLGTGGKTLGLRGYVPAPLPEIPDLGNASLEAIPRDKRNRLKDRAMDRAGLLLEQAGVPGILRWLVKQCWLSGWLDKALKLD